MTDDLGIIDLKLNPFVLKKNGDNETKWIKNRRGFTLKRKVQCEKLFGQNIESIFSQRNYGKYVAFTAIRWGFAIINKEGKLEETDIWHHKDLYDGRGKLIDKSEIKSKSNSDYNGKNHRKPNAPSRKPTLISSPMQRDELVLKLRMFQVEPIIEKYLDKDHLLGKTAGEIIVFSFDHTIYRAFPDETPTSRYKKWRWYNNPNELCKQLDALQSQEDFDRFLIELGESLVTDWGQLRNINQPSKMNIGYALKISNLVLKHIVLSKHTCNSNLKKWLHVPWDKFTLNPLHIIYQGYPAIPKYPSQGFVKSLDIYLKLYTLISGITQEAGVDRINFEIWAWDASYSK